ncbi:hypothetical protein GC194_03230 [bacterium]|nr:hypothetical protein [bacterium]
MDYTLHCWQLKHQIDSDDDVNDLHIAFDIDDLPVINEMLDQISRFELSLYCEPFPDKSPQHYDVGMESYMKNYKSEVADIEKLTFLITHEEDEILLWNNGNTEAFIKLTDKRLKEMKKVMHHTKNNAYLQENVMEATRITDDNDFKPCKIVFWAATNGVVIYY